MIETLKSVCRYWKPFIFLLIAASLAACAGSAPTKKAPFRVGYTQQWGDYTLIVAQKKGFFEKYGVEVEPVYYDTSAKSLPDMASSQIDAGTFSFGDILNINSHTSLTTVAISDDGGAGVIMALPEIKSISDLKSKQVGVDAGSTYELMINEMLKSANMSPSDINLVNIDPKNIPQAIRDGKIQAGLTWEPYTTQARGLGDHILYSSDQVSELFANAIAFRTEIVQERPEDIKNFLKAWFEAVDYRAKNPDDANHLIAFSLNIPVNQVSGDAKLMTLTDNIKIFSQDQSGNSQSVYTLAKLNGDFLIRNGSLTKMPSLSQLFDPSYLGK